MKRFIFWNTMQRSPLKVNRRFGGTCRLHRHGRRISQARNQRESRWQAKMGVICSSETSVDFQRTTRRYIAKDRTLHPSSTFSLNMRDQVLYPYKTTSKIMTLYTLLLSLCLQMVDRKANVSELNRGKHLQNLT
jgi:hypothetical protein